MADEEKNEETTEEAQPTESAEDARARVEHVRSTQFFGDLTVVPEPTDPEVSQEASQEEAEDAAPVAAGGEEGVEVESGATVVDHRDDSETDETVETDEGVTVNNDDESDNLSATDKVTRIKQATSVEEVDALAEGDDRVTVQREADKKREELGE